MDMKTFVTKFAISARAGHRMAVNWVIVAAGTAAAAYLSLTADQQRDLLAAFHVPPIYVPVAVTVIGLVARFWPQKSITPAVADAKSAEAPQPPEGGTP